MKRKIVGVTAALSLALAVPVFAIEGSQSSVATSSKFEQIKADRLKKIDEMINSLQAEKVCVQDAKSQDDISTCRSKHKPWR